MNDDKDDAQDLRHKFKKWIIVSTCDSQRYTKKQLRRVHGRRRVRTSLLITKAPTNTSPIEPRKRIVAIIRTGLNIYCTESVVCPFPFPMPRKRHSRA